MFFLRVRFVDGRGRVRDAMWVIEESKNLISKFDIRDLVFILFVGVVDRGGGIGWQLIAIDIDWMKLIIVIGEKRSKFSR